MILRHLRITCDRTSHWGWARALLGGAILWSLGVGLAAGASVEYRVTVRVGSESMAAAPASVRIALPKEMSDRGLSVQLVPGAEGDRQTAGGRSREAIPVQLTEIGLRNEQLQDAPPADHVWRELHLLLPALEANATWSGRLTVTEDTTEPKSDAPGFTWSAHGDIWNELSYGDRGVLRYMHEPLDESTPERRAETYKVYHHVYDLAGEQFVTKGPGGLYPHHRGLFYGFNRITYGDQKADVWHCNNGEQQAHEATLSEQVGRLLGRHRVQVAWKGQDRQAFAREQRELTAYAVDGAQLIDFTSRLDALVPQVKLDGDPQHAGFQFRASQYVPDHTSEQTYYLRPDGRGRPGEFRNWPDDPQHLNLPWNALSFVLQDQRYTCCYFDAPTNPRPARYSERDYGRFGCYFEYDLTPDRPLVVNYRIWLQEGETEVQQVQRKYAAYVGPATLTAERVDEVE